MGSVKLRLSVSIDEEGFIRPDDRSSDWETADKLAGYRLDRRRSYCIIDGAVHQLCTWTAKCSGCSYSGQGFDEAGPGCFECGYTGKRRDAMFLPLTPKSDRKEL